MSNAYLRWRCPVCQNLHTRLIRPHPDDGRVLVTRRFPRENVDHSKVLLINSPGDQVSVLPTPIDLTCGAGDALIPHEENLP